MKLRRGGRQKLFKRVRQCMRSVERDLDSDYANARIFYEADVHHLCVVHLQRRLGARWRVVSKHKIGGTYPDIAIYHAPSHSSRVRLIRHDFPQQALVAVIEVKYRASLGNDLNKLARLQRWYARKLRAPLLTWMMFGDHFRPDVHGGNYKSQERRATAIEAWVARNPHDRGGSLLRVGVKSARDSPHEGEIRECLNTWWWDREE